MSSDRGSWSEHLLNITLLVIVIAAVLLPGGPARTVVNEWLDERRLRVTIENHWDLLETTSARLDDSRDQPAMLIEFGDYQCIFCRRVHPYLVRLASLDPSLPVAYRHVPRSGDRLAENAARAAICAEFQGRFRQMHALLYETEDWKETEDWEALARRAGVEDVLGFHECLDGPEVTERLEDDSRLATTLGVFATPTFFFPGGRHIGYADEEEILNWLGSREAARLRSER